MSSPTANERRRALPRLVWWSLANLPPTPVWMEYPLETHRPQNRRARFWRWLLGG